MGKYVMALDAGTTSNRCILFNKKGEIVSVAQKEFTQYFPKPGWVEHNADEIWSTQLGVAVEAMSKIGASSEDIAALGITNQRETAIVWDKKTGEPVCNAIVWQCRRTAEYCDQLKEKGYTEMIRKKTGLIIDAYFSATKIKWILDHVEGARERAERGELLFGTVETWLIWKLTKGKVHVTDYSNASRTMLFNINTLEWDEEILNLLDIPSSMLSQGYAVQLYLWNDRQLLFWRADSDRRSGRRPAVRTVRAGLFPSGSGEKYVRDRLLPFDEYRGKACVFGKRAGDYHRMGAGRKGRICAGRFYLCGGSRYPVAER